MSCDSAFSVKGETTLTLTGTEFLSEIHLVLFFTRGVSLNTWAEVGMLEREAALYRSLRPMLRRVTFVTYGDTRDLRHRDKMHGIDILCNRRRLPLRWYTLMLTQLFARQWGGKVIYKSNQVQGAETALQAAQNAGKPFIARCGYLFSEFEEQRCGANSPEAARAARLEKTVFTAADHIIVTTPLMSASVQQRYSIASEKISVIPNYVETDVFQPQEMDRPAAARQRVCFIGRLEAQKNPIALLEALKGSDVQLLVVGNGSLKETMQAYVQENKLDVQFLGNLPHRQLPDMINSTDIFILPSLYEGHPKTLIEAMSCGAAVIGANSPGIREIITHGENGWLCETDAKSIHDALVTLLSDAGLRKRLGSQARQYALAHFALKRVLELEIAVYRKVAA